MNYISLQRLLACFLFIMLTFNAFAGYDYPPSNFRSTSNPYYWKNKMPFPGYWQQDVHYNIEAELFDKENYIAGKEHLTYWNNSPDTLFFAYFHLYQNAFTPGSYEHDLYKNNGIKVRFGNSEIQGLGTTIQSFKVDGDSVKTELNNTILKVYFNKPLPPGQAKEFDISFRTYFDQGTLRRRMKIFYHDNVKHFDGVHWYPRISVYDRKFGWTTDQHLDREFYGDYGTYDVSLSFPSKYVMEATGTLLNEKEVLPDTLREKLDIKNYKKRGTGAPYAAGNMTPKTWRYHAENVHDFAWTADPTYRYGVTEWKGIKCVALVQERNAPGWQGVPAFTAKVVETYSRDFGMYAYPKMVVADAQDGMEYPMLTLCGGWEPGNHFVIAHEVGHNWFFGMIGNNETYRAMLDEGFTQYLTTWSLNRIDGRFPKNTTSNKYTRRYQTTLSHDETSLFLPYIRSAIQEDNTMLNTHSDDFGGAVGHGGGYGLVYYKTATMLANLQYTLGDSLFTKAMKHYFSQWAIAHPYPEDFRNSIIQYTHADLNWFFDEWMETSKTLDYAVEKVKKGEKEGEYKVTFRRKGQMQMPLDFTVLTKDGQKFSYYIPNNYFSKRSTATELPMWFGWDKLRPTYEATIQVPGKIKDIIIDTTWRLADVNLMNNRLKCPIKWRFDSQVSTTPDRRFYEVFWRPELWYNSIDGPKVGLHVNGDYLDMKEHFEATLWYNTGVLNDKRFSHKSERRDPVSFNLLYRNPLYKLDKDMSWYFIGRGLDGLYLSRIGAEKKFKGNNTFGLYTKTMIRPRYEDLDYLLFPDCWYAKKWNNTLNASITHNYNQTAGRGFISLNMRSSTLFSDYDYTGLNANWQHFVSLSKFVLRTRFYANWLNGSNIPLESKVYLFQANPEEMMDNKFYRSRGIIPDEWIGGGSQLSLFQVAGGMNMRGYMGSEIQSGGITYRGNGGAALNMELDFDRFIRFHPGRFLSRYFSINTYLFGDAGAINTAQERNTFRFSTLYMDAGIGTAITLKAWGPLQKADPSTLRLDMPIYVNHPPGAEEKLMFRWIVGIGRSF